VSDTNGIPPILDSKTPAPLSPPVLSGDASKGVRMPKSAWGFWPTTGFALCVGVFYVLAQVVVVLVAGALAGDLSDPAAIEKLASNGEVISLSLVASTPFAVGLSIFFAWTCPGVSVREYLGFVPVSWKVVLLGWISVIALGVSYDWVSSFFDRPEIPEFMINAYQTARVKPLLWFAVIVLAPVAEEVFFRGFLFKGLEASAVGGVGAVLLTSLAWAAIHLQYDLFNILTLFTLGILLGLFRLRTGSMVPALLMHVLQNLMATLQVAWWLSEHGPPPPLP
jgi:membrane protease YdiL (CAAX protease family)